jgi:Predicted esterase of the alpha-beta hydrolase superfamily
MLPVKSFEDLEIPLRIVATNFHTLKERVFSEGNIIEPLMASIAYPSVFFPQPVEGEYYMDGGATNIVPFDIIRHECDVLIAIDVSAVRPNDFKPGIKNALSATWAATQEALISLKLQHCPVEIFERPIFDDVATFEFFKYKSIYSRAEEYISGFKQKLTRILERE